MDTYISTTSLYCDIRTLPAKLSDDYNIFELNGFILIWKSWPGKTNAMYKAIQFGRHCEIFLKTFGGAPHWNSEDIKKLKKAGIRIKRELSYNSPAFEYYAGDVELPIFPIHINAIIAGYSIFGSPFSENVLQMFKQIYFRYDRVSINDDKISIHNGSLLCIMYNNGSISITIQNMKYIYDNYQLYIECKVNCTYAYIYYTPELYVTFAGRARRRLPNADELLKLPMEFIETIDPKDEFGLRRIFQPMLTTQSIHKAIHNGKFWEYISNN